MNYNLHYNLLIEKSKNRNRPDICERHHILPKSMGGNNKKENIVYLTPKEHYVAHHLLWKIHRNREMHYAFWLMVNKISKNGSREYKVNSRTYQSAKEQHQIEVSLTHTGKVVSKETRLKSSMSLKGKPAWCKGKTGIHSEQGIENIKKSRTGAIDTEETRQKRINSAKLRPMPENIQSDSARAKRRESNRKWREQNQITCPHCDKTGTKYNMMRYHFDNCPIVNTICETRLSKSKGIKLKTYECDHCGIETSMGNLKRWHLDNCKKRIK